VSVHAIRRAAEMSEYSDFMDAISENNRQSEQAKLKTASIETSKLSDLKEDAFLAIHSPNLLKAKSAQGEKDA
jgi:hypothetical protein